VALIIHTAHKNYISSTQMKLQ